MNWRESRQQRPLRPNRLPAIKKNLPSPGGGSRCREFSFGLGGGRCEFLLQPDPTAPMFFLIVPDPIIQRTWTVLSTGNCLRVLYCFRRYATVTT